MDKRSEAVKMVLAIETIVLCMLFTLGVMVKMRDPISALYDYPPKIQEHVRSLDQYQDKIPTQKDRLTQSSTTPESASPSFF